MAIIATDAASMLAEALEQMDGLISDDTIMMEGIKSYGLSHSPNERVLGLAEDLQNAIINVPAMNRANIRIPITIAEFLLDWLRSQQFSSDNKQNSSIVSNNNGGERYRAQIRRLEDEKDSLILQVSVLTDQVEAQGEKMRDLEFTLEEQKIKEEELEQDLEALNSEYEAKVSQKESEIELLKDHIEVLLDEQETLQRILGDGHASTGLKSQLREKASEVNKLKLEVDTLTAVIEDKDRKLKDLQAAVSKFKRVEDLVVRAHQRKGSETSQTTVTELSIPDSSSAHSSEGITCMSPTSMSTASDSRSSTPTGKNSVTYRYKTVKQCYCSFDFYVESYVKAVHNPVTPSLEAIKNPQPATRRSFGKGFFKIKGPKSTSEPNIYICINVYYNVSANECILIENAQKNPSSPERKNPKIIWKRNIIGKMRRTKSLSDNQANCVNAAPVDLSNFKKDERQEYGDQLELPFAGWTTEMIMNWLDDLGLGCYTEGCRQHVTCGEDLLRASGVELDKLLGIRHHLHRKKLQLALQAFVSDSPDVMGRLSNHWVLGWLEDIGLPHYKDTFSDACVDGRMLNYLTIDDLQQLKVTNALHHVSIQRAIQCLRFNNFHPNSLKRYPIDESWQKGADVLLWTNGRVVEWLRLVDLAEYAPNLRGNGVHGALMILEPRFTADTLAALLSIPPTKTLLRRHLTSHFQSLIGPACQSLKDQSATSPSFTPLMPSVKQKVMKKSKSLGALRGKKGHDPDNYVCPMDFDIPQQLKPTVTRTRRRSDEDYNRSRRRDSDEVSHWISV
ncbi:hypothetical protein QZH41_016802 [Actinostola sp. cb2023]|nr:hypothetical protein QZH41_016802 [Actinostola sp. cb2023]